MKIIVSQLANSKIKHMVSAVKTEIGALISGHITIDGDVYVSDVYMTKQIVTSGAIDFDQDSCNAAVLKAMMNDEMLIGWVHSHADMGVFWSTTDTDTIDKLINFAGTFICSIVSNHKLEALGRIDYISTSVFGERQEIINNVPIMVDYDYPEDVKAAFQADIDEYVKEKPAYVSKTKVDYTKQQSYWRGGRKYVTDCVQSTLIDDEEEINIIEDNMYTMTDKELLDELKDQEIENLVRGGMSEEDAKELITG